MMPLALYCKSYRTDLRRVVRLLQSIERFNTDQLPIYISVPEADLALFREYLGGSTAQLIIDESILQTSPRIDPVQLKRMPGGVAQQVIKSEFWRLGLADAYVCLDSDAVFIRPFNVHDFLAPDGYLYTVLDEAHDLLEAAMQHGRSRIVEAFVRESVQVQKLFARPGRGYSFGPFPLVWHRKVWESLDSNYLQPRSMSFADAIAQAPIESRWYGEALLAYQAIPLHPCQALFKVYHYAWQLDQETRRGVTQKQLAQLYCGVIYQSAWEREMDWPTEGGNRFSRLGRKIRRLFARI
ncbi:MAG: hypothetical protein K2W93_02930 [Burkholderiaceae bacterium]|nr:hypothetical protein [Burkholderiaceae bacterium]